MSGHHDLLDVWVAIVMIGALADVAWAAGCVDAEAVAAATSVVVQRRLALRRAGDVGDGEVEHEGDAPWVLPGQGLVAVEILLGEVVPVLLDNHPVGARIGRPKDVLLVGERDGGYAEAGRHVRLAATHPRARPVLRRLGEHQPRRAVEPVARAGQRRGELRLHVPAHAGEHVARRREDERRAGEHRELPPELVVGPVGGGAVGGDGAVRPSLAARQRHVHELHGEGPVVLQSHAVVIAQVVAVGVPLERRVRRAPCEESARGVEGAVAGDLEAVQEASGRHAEWVRYANVAAPVGAAGERDRL
ncbi:Os10g0116650, partial [Oryza sativa Japonica Group]